MCQHVRMAAHRLDGSPRTKSHHEMRLKQCRRYREYLGACVFSSFIPCRGTSAWRRGRRGQASPVDCQLSTVDHGPWTVSSAVSAAHAGVGATGPNRPSGWSLRPTSTHPPIHPSTRPPTYCLYVPTHPPVGGRDGGRGSPWSSCRSERRKGRPFCGAQRPAPVSQLKSCHRIGRVGADVRCFFLLLCVFFFLFVLIRRQAKEGEKHLTPRDLIPQEGLLGSVRFGSCIVHRASCLAAAAFATREPLTMAQGSPVGEQSIEGKMAPGFTVSRPRGTWAHPITASSRTRRAPLGPPRPLETGEFPIRFPIVGWQLLRWMQSHGPWIRNRGWLDCPSKTAHS